jgi:hypothetical protein
MIFRLLSYLNISSEIIFVSEFMNCLVAKHKYSNVFRLMCSRVTQSKSDIPETQYSKKKPFGVSKWVKLSFVPPVLSARNDYKDKLRSIQKTYTYLYPEHIDYVLQKDLYLLHIRLNGNKKNKNHNMEVVTCFLCFLVYEL